MMSLLLRSERIAVKHLRCIIKSVRSIAELQKECAKSLSLAFKALRSSLDLL